MKCPACSKALRIMLVSGVELEVCDGGCGGIWFDQFEFKKFDEQHEPDAETILRLKVDPLVKVDYSKQRACPKCVNIVMRTNFVSIKRQVKIDECAKCAGIWLDAGELQNIRMEYPTQKDREKAAEKLYDEMFGKQLAEAKMQSNEELATLRRFANAFRFICPSFYIPGKQKGGAF